MLGMRLGSEQPLGEGGDRRAGAARPGNQTRWGPLGVRPVRGRHVSRVGHRAPLAPLPPVGGDPPAAMVDLDGRPGGPDVDFLADQAERHGVEAVIERHVVVDAHRRFLPRGQLVSPRRQGA